MSRLDRFGDFFKSRISNFFQFAVALPVLSTCTRAPRYPWTVHRSGKTAPEDTSAPSRISTATTSAAPPSNGSKEKPHRSRARMKRRRKKKVCMYKACKRLRDAGFAYNLTECVKSTGELDAKDSSDKFTRNIFRNVCYENFLPLLHFELLYQNF